MSAERSTRNRNSSVTMRPTVNTEINTRQWRWENPYEHPRRFMRNFSTTKYAKKKRLPVFNKNDEINSMRNDGGLYFPNARATALKHRGLVEAFDYFDPSKDPHKGEKLIYIEKGGHPVHVTVEKEPTSTEIELSNDSNGNYFILPTNTYGFTYMLFKHPIRGIRTHREREESLKRGPFGKRNRFSGGRTRKRPVKRNK